MKLRNRILGLTPVGTLLLMASSTLAQQFDGCNPIQASDEISATAELVDQLTQKTYCDPINDPEWRRLRAVAAEQACNDGLEKFVQMMTRKWKDSTQFTDLRQAEYIESEVAKLRRGEKSMIIREASQLEFIDINKEASSRKTEAAKIPDQVWEDVFNIRDEGAARGSKFKGNKGIGEIQFVGMMNVHLPTCEPKKTFVDVNTPVWEGPNDYFSSNGVELKEGGKEKIAKLVDLFCSNVGRGAKYDPNKKFIIHARADKFNTTYKNEALYMAGNVALSHDRATAMKKFVMDRFNNPDPKSPCAQLKNPIVLTEKSIEMDYKGDEGDGTSGPSPYFDPAKQSLDEMKKKYGQNNPENIKAIEEMYTTRPNPSTQGAAYAQWINKWAGSKFFEQYRQVGVKLPGLTIEERNAASKEPLGPVLSYSTCRFKFNQPWVMDGHNDHDRTRNAILLALRDKKVGGSGTLLENKGYPEYYKTAARQLSQEQLKSQLESYAKRYNGKGLKAANAESGRVDQFELNRLESVCQSNIPMKSIEEQIRGFNRERDTKAGSINPSN